MKKIFTLLMTMMVENVTGEAAAAKRIANGQLLIQRDGKTYNALGVQLH